jgi:hypothetical protein
MKRFGWSRPALLIGFVLSDKVEDAIYQTIQAYGFEVFARPIVQVLIALVILSVIVGIRTKRTVADLQSNPRYAPQNRGPQLLFLAALIGFAGWAVADSLPRVFSMSVFPITIGVLTLIPLTILAIGMLTTSRPKTFLFDANKDVALVRRQAHSDLYYLGWLVALLAVSALLGFVVAIALFIFIFLRYEARASYTISTVACVAFLLLLAVFAQTLVLEYPEGLLQDYVPLPWPFAI